MKGRLAGRWCCEDMDADVWLSVLGFFCVGRVKRGTGVVLAGCHGRARGCQHSGYRYRREKAD